MADTVRIAANLDPELVPEEFFARHVEPGTTYDDEPTVEIDPGWYVVAINDDEFYDVEIHVKIAYDVNGNDITEGLARKIADLLTDFALGD